MPFTYYLKNEIDSIGMYVLSFNFAFFSFYWTSITIKNAYIKLITCEYDHQLIIFFFTKSFKEQFYIREWYAMIDFLNIWLGVSFLLYFVAFLGFAYRTDRFFAFHCKNCRLINDYTSFEWFLTLQNW